MRFFIEDLCYFDKNQRGFISIPELKHLLATLDEKLRDDEVEQLFVYQEDLQGNVNYDKFVRIIMND